MRGIQPPATLFAAPANGPDFRRSESDLSHPLRIIVYGDMRFTDPTETKATNPKVRRWLVDQVAAEKPDAVLLSGDVPWHGSEASDYDEYRRRDADLAGRAPSDLSGARQSRILGRREPSSSVWRTGGMLSPNFGVGDGIPCSLEVPFMFSTSTAIHRCCRQ